MQDKLIIFDTTLRDGEQSPGASMTKDEKIRIAKALEKMRVDVIEAGFPIASPGDFESVKAVAELIKDSTVCGLARALDNDIDTAAEAIKPATSGRIHTFIATSPIHMRDKLRMQPDEVVAQAVHSVKRARNYTDNVEFSPEDAGRSELDFLCRIIEQVIDAGATTINIPDTVGYNLPHRFGELIGQLIERIPNADKAVFSVHCHNDLGLAVANSLSAVIHGARQVECTINGLGERAGNAALEEIVMSVKTRQDIFACNTNIDTTQIVHCSKLVSNITGFPVQPNKAIVGANAFAHESGIHQDGVLKSRETYEIMSAQDVGWHANKMVLGKHSGRNAFKTRMQELDVEFEKEEDLNAAFSRFKDLADKKHEIYDDDLIALVTESLNEIENERIKLIAISSHSETGETPSANITLSVDGAEKQAQASGGGQVDASFKAIESIINSGCDLQLYSVSNITTGTDSQGEVTVRLDKAGRVINGLGSDTDIVTASAKAYINALNKALESYRATTSTSMNLNQRQTVFLQSMGLTLWQEQGRVPEVLTTPAVDPVIEDNNDWGRLQASVRQCTQCALHESRTQTVFGVGDIHADCLIIGEAPGAEEDKQGEPFVGRAGKLLNNMLRAIGLQRETVYIANILKCRPPSNRDPRVEEVVQCEHYLQQQIAMIQPKLIIALGRIAAQNLLKVDTPIGKMRGQPYTYEPGGIPVIVTYHPAYLLRSPSQKSKSWHDLLLAKAQLDQTT